ncbi:hypothetical protein K402DRAFT_417407 [Aulographum hederae CBS 113979]|uniref:RNA binding protein Nrd1 n=1 Tax=Aulographum hederae CBS 113979 TaxID=1176131 RepID=A0A6G1HCG8_9PEZI|nr:hypothetical protein K402DRAFT_417407 [Aulographum hederae CBS 113979]
MPTLDDLVPMLESLWAGKPPGVAKSKIEASTQICIDNIKADLDIIQKLAHHFTKTPDTHKLGVLYVIDSVTRRWIEQARQTGQALSGKDAPNGTYAAGVYKMTEVLPALMREYLPNVPQAQKERLLKLVDIWEKGSTFPLPMIKNFKDTISNPTAQAATISSTQSLPNGSVQPPAAQIASNNQQVARPNKQDISTLDKPTGVPPQNTSTLYGDAGSSQQPSFSTVSQVSAPFSNGTASYANPAQAGNGTQGQAPQGNGVNWNVLMSLNPTAQVGQAGASATPATMLQDPNQAIQIVQGLIQSGVPVENIPQFLQSLQTMGMMIPTAGAAPASQPASAAAPAPGQQTGDTHGYDNSRRNSLQDDGHYGTHGYPDRSRRRSRSPDRRRRSSPINRRQSPVYGVYDPSMANQESAPEYNEPRRGGRGGGRRSQRNEYRQRSPPPAARNQQASAQSTVPKDQQKFIDFDSTLKEGDFKVLSRTLFVGGVSCSEAELKSIFSRFGKVQTCIVNMDKRHAFVKMYTRQDTVAAKIGMETMQDASTLNKARSTRWGVGFGPRECADYTTGISIIPIERLTDADHKWMMTAPFGGTGGRPLESGMVVEEPDIEIGAGVSSKAISRRIDSGPGKRPTGGNWNARAQNGPPAQNNNNIQHGNQGRNRRNDRQDNRRQEVSNVITAPPAVPGFGFQLPGMNLR